MLYRILNKVLAFLIDGHFWISSATVLLYLSTAKIFAIEHPSMAMAVFLFCGTWFVYGLHSVITHKKYGRYNRLLIWVAVLPAIFAFLYLPAESQVAFLVPMLIAAAYILPVFRKNKKLRDFPLIKIFLVAGAWTALSTTIPVQSMALDPDIKLLTFSAERFLLIFGITLPFDIRDIAKDKLAGVKTLPMLLGIGESKILALSCLSGAGLLALFHFHVGLFDSGLLISEVLSLSLASGLILLSQADKHPWFFTGLLDGIMVLQPILFLLCR